MTRLQRTTASTTKCRPATIVANRMITARRFPSVTLAFLVFLLGLVLIPPQQVDSAPKRHGGSDGGSSSVSNADEPSGTYYNVVDLNDDYPTNKTLNATEIAALPPFTKTWPPFSDAEDEDGPDQTSFPNPEYVR